MGADGTESWYMDFGNYSAPIVLGAPAHAKLTFDGRCRVTATWDPVYAEAVNPPYDGWVLRRQSESDFEVTGWTGRPTPAGGEIPHRFDIEIFDPNGERILRRSESLPPYCVFTIVNGECSPMSPAFWESLIEGEYLFRVQARGIHGVHSPWNELTFRVDFRGTR